jgi:hypothetical protein
MAFRKQQPRLRFEDSIRQVLRASGSPIDAAIRVPLEKRFGRDFGRVRVHADNLAARSARRLGARAYTAGSHIVFAQGRYDPRTREGLWLLSHELAHVVQQDAVLPTSLTLGCARDPLEHAADRAADLVAAGRCLPPGFAFGAAPAGTVQRHVDEPCPGIVIRPYEPGNPGIGGNSALEIAYKQAFEDRVDSCFFGSQYDKERPGVDVFFPKGAPHSVIRNRILTRLRGLVYQRRPDIIDFQERVIYEIKTPDYANDGMVQLESYYRIANEVIAEHARSMGSGRRLTPTDEERPFDRSKARWYPRTSWPIPATGRPSSARRQPTMRPILA